jgi:hypothetical protein
MTALMPITQSAPVHLKPIAPALIAGFCVIAATFVLRFGQFGNPIAGLDEQFYLLVGDRMWHGELPYVDIWDRKPFGLFLLFAAIRLLPGDGVLAAQILATLFVAGTAWCIVLLVRRAVGWHPAVMGGIFYVAAVNELWGETTQTPTFYNLPIAIAALLTLHAAHDPRARCKAAAGAMLLAGLAIQIKTSAIFQGGFFGLWLLGAVWRDSRAAKPLLTAAIQLAAIAAAPTLAVMALYVALGEYPAWWQANITSVLAKGMPTDVAAKSSFAESLILFFPVGTLAAVGLWAQTKRLESYSVETGFYVGWIVLAVVDFLALGGYYPHYTLPLILACAPFISHAFALRRAGVILFALTLAWPLLHAAILNPRIAALERGYAAQVTARIPAEVRERCLFIYEGPVAYYRLTDACRVTRFPFSAHISSRREGPSLGINPAVALDQALARRPFVVMTVEHSNWPDRNLSIERRLGRHLLRDYRLIARVPHRHYSQKERVLLWQLRV